MKGYGGQQDYGMRIYDPRVGRFLSVDPLTQQYPMLTPYQYASNNPIAYIDLDGLEGVRPDKPGEHEGQTEKTSTIEGVAPGGYGQVTREWIWHEGGVNGSKKGWMNQTDYFEKILKPLATSDNYGDFLPKFRFAWSRKEADKIDYTALVNSVGKFIKENPTYDSWAKYLPIWGSFQQAKLDFSVGKYGWGTFNSLMGISDIFLVKSILQAPFKGGLTALTKDFSHWSGNGWRRFYGREGFAEAGEHLHHWLLKRNGATSGSGFGWWLKNQKFNLIRMSDIEWLGITGRQRHTLIHGGTIQATGLNWNNPLGAGLKYIYGTPTWFKTGLNYAAGQLINSQR